jgi:predicted lipid-binding transport protein (Tim44 family)
MSGSHAVNSQLLFILLLATVAGIILFRLYTVLGRRTGNERPPQERFERIGGATQPPKSADNVVLLPDRSARPETAEASDPVTRGLLDIKLADRTFDANHFVEGARRAYEMIVTAFAKSDRDALRPLVSDDVYAAFEHAIAEREVKKEKVEFTFVGFREVKIVHAELKKTLAEVTLSFAAQFISATTDAEGNPVEGDNKTVRDVTDVWTFERNVRASDPNWRLVATSGEAEPQAD